MNDLVVIPARGGSKRVPNKNIRLLGGRPLIHYTLDAACGVYGAESICVSSDSDSIISSVRDYGLEVPFRRPDHLATDAATTHSVLLHALDHFEEKGRRIDRLVLLQPTSPFRTSEHIRQAAKIYDAGTDMVVSVRVAKSNPYRTLFEENLEGWLSHSKKLRNPDGEECPAIYELNGAIYLVRSQTLRNAPMPEFERVRKYVMREEDSVDVDTPLDWAIAEVILQQRMLSSQDAIEADAVKAKR